MIKKFWTSAKLLGVDFTTTALWEIIVVAKPALQGTCFVPGTATCWCMDLLCMDWCMDSNSHQLKLGLYHVLLESVAFEMTWKSIKSIKFKFSCKSIKCKKITFRWLNAALNDDNICVVMYVSTYIRSLKLIFSLFLL